MMNNQLLKHAANVAVGYMILATTDDGGTGEENGNIDVDESVGENITGLNVTDTVSSKNETTEESGNDTDPSSNDGGTVEKDGMNVTDVKAVGTVSGIDESVEESGNDTDPASDNNGIRTSMSQIRRLQTQHPITMTIELPTRMERMSQM